MITSLDTLDATDDTFAYEDPPHSVIDFLSGVCRLCLLAVLMAAPWFFGGVHTQIQYSLFVGIFIVLSIWGAVCLLRLVLGRPNTQRIPLAFVSLAALFGLGVYQLSQNPAQPKPAAIQSAVEGAISKSTDEVERRQLARTALIEQVRSFRTICEAATRFALSRFAMAIAVFFLATQLFATQRSQVWLWGALAINGAALAFFGICQQLSWNGQLFWSYPLQHGGVPFSAFVNRNTAAGYLGLCLAAAIGFLLWAVTQMTPFARLQRAKRTSSRFRGNDSVSNLNRLIESVGEISGAQVLALLFVILITAGILLATSRGGWLALVVAVIVTGVVASRSRGLWVGAFVSSVAILTVSLVLWSGLVGRISDRWSKLASINVIAKDGRWEHWLDSVRILADFPLTGTGYGTYPFAYLPYQTHPSIAHLRFYHAENQFLEWFVEGGFIGGILILLSLLFVMTSVVALLRRSSLDPAGFVGLFAIANLCVGAFFDSGPWMTANMLAIAALSGAITGRSALVATSTPLNLRSQKSSSAAWLSSSFRLVVGCVILVVCFVGLNEVKAAAAVHTITDRLPPLDSPDALDRATVGQTISELEAAVQNYPSDPDAHFALAELWIYQFRLEELQHARELQDQSSPDLLWIMTTPAAVYRQLHQWSAAGQYERIEFALESETIHKNLVPAFAHLQRAEAACPLMPDVNVMLATLKFASDADEFAGEPYLRRALLLGPSSAATCYQVGQLAHFANLKELSVACWKTSLEFSPEYLLKIHQALAGTYSLQEELDLVIPRSPELWLQLGQLFVDGGEPSQSAWLAERAKVLLEAISDESRTAEQVHLLGRANAQTGDVDDAIREYRRALAMVPFQIEWRIELTRLLLQHKGLHLALREAETCVAIAPGQPRLQKMVRDLQTKLADEQSQSVGALKINPRRRTK